VSSVDRPRASPLPGRWAVIERLFARALDLPPGERDEFLAAASSDDDELRREVRKLLAAHDAVIAQGGTGERLLEDLDAERSAALIEPPLIEPPLLPALRGALRDRYLVERLLGSGGMAEVFAARDLRHDRLVAIKIVRADSATPRLADRFEREVRLAARLQHPHIVPLYDSGLAAGHRYYVMPLVEGPTLRQRLQESERLPVDEVLRIVEEVAGALDYAHASGIVHRDIKPENVLLSGGHALVADFGIARATDFATPSTLTQDGTFVGTPAYMSPEQAAGDRIVDGRSDQYALACVAYELLTGRPPFRGATAQAVIAQHFVAAVPPLELGLGSASRALDEVMARALATEPAARFATTMEFASALRTASTRTHDTGPTTAHLGSPSAGNVPSVASPLIGRDEILADAIALVRRSDVRLVTFTGTGGTGKTRLALEVGARLSRSFEGCIWFVPLAHVSDPGLVPSSIGHVLGLHDQAAPSLLDAFAAYVGERRLLLVLDNFEQVVAAASWLCELLARVPTLKALVTSRVLLRVHGEHDLPVPPLEVPDLGASPDAHDLAAYPSVQLFTERARAVEPSFTLTEENAAAVAEICVRLDGLPLAIELAAARINLLAPRAILGRLEHRLRLLTRGARDRPERHQTLRQAIAWSYELLGEAERRLFTRLSVFAGGCTVEAAEAVCDVDGSLGIDVLDGISALLDASLLQRDARNGTHDSPRIRMLETIREFALELLARDAQAAAVRDRHRDWFLDLARRAAPNLTGPEQDTWLGTLGSEDANLRAALDRSVQLGDAETALAFGAALWRYWLVRGHLREGCECLDRVLSLPAADRLDALRADALTGAGTLAHIVCDNDAAASYLSRALELRRRLGDSAGVARALADLGWAAMKCSEFPEAKRLSHESLELSRSLDDKRLMALALSNLGWVAMNEGDYPTARGAFEQGLELRRELADRRGAAYMLLCLEWTASRSGDYTRVVSLAEEILPILRAIGDVRLYGAALAALARALLALGDARHAQSVLEGEVLPIMRKTGDRWNLSSALCLLSCVAREQGDIPRAEALAAESLDIRSAIRDRHGVAESLAALALAAHSRGDEARAQALFTESLALRRAIGDRAGIAECEHALGALATGADVS
jgi:predicted ATPase/serine/threonine protein kinase